jgi:hypothetical protein
MKDKFILDACCGARMFWFNKNHPNAIYIDNRIREKGFVSNRLHREIKPDYKMDFTDLKFKDKSFKLIIMDPPHLLATDENKGHMIESYGHLKSDTWEENIKNGLSECWRCLDDFGILIFKWNDHDISLKRLSPLFPCEPLIGQKTSFKTKHKSSTLCFCFMKIPNLTLNKNQQQIKEEKQ